MSQEQQTKVCRVCYEQMDARAKKCPHCRQWQHPLTVVTLHPLLVSAILLVPLLAAYGFIGFTVCRMLSRGADFRGHEGQIKVLESRMLWGQEEGRPVIMVVGELQNDTSMPWEDVLVEVQFTDAAGRLVDTCAERQSWTLAPEGRSGFRVSMRADLAKETYAGYTVFIRGAREAEGSIW